MDKIFKDLENAIINALNNENQKPLTEESLKVSEAFHNKYYDEMFDKRVKVTLKDKTEIIGLYNDEFYEDSSIFVDYNIVKISDIETMISVD